MGLGVCECEVDGGGLVGGGVSHVEKREAREGQQTRGEEGQLGLS